MISKVEGALKNLGIKPESKIAVAFSGGCDSSAMLDCFVKLSKAKGFELCAIHIDHSLRGAESDRDAAFASDTCKQYNIPLYTEKVDVKGEREKSGDSTELCARRLRYEVFDRFIEVGWLVATAHTASDNAETVLFNLIRGSGITGICGIPRRRGGYIRPILDCTRDETEGYCKANNIAFVTDSSNLTDDYTRNFIRHNIMPLVKSINQSAERSISSTSDRLCKIDKMLSDLASSALEQSAANGGYDCKQLKELDPAVLSCAVRMATAKATGRAPDSNKTEGICSLVLNGGRIQLYDGWYASGGRLLRFYKEQSAVSEVIELKIGEIKFGEKSLKIEKVNNQLITNAIDCDKIIGKAVVRSRLSGDMIKLHNRPQKQLRRLMNELNIPSGERDAYPVVADDEGVIFVPGGGVASRVKADDKTKNMIIISIIGGQ